MYEYLFPQSKNYVVVLHEKIFDEYDPFQCFLKIKNIL